MNRSSRPQFDNDVVAVLHRSGKVWRGLIAQIEGQKPTVIDTKEFSFDRLTGLDAWLDQHKASSVLCVLPASTVICRNCSLPEASPEQLEQALHLQAEAHLLGIAAPHRLAMAVLPNAVGETSRSGLILAWPEAAAFEPPLTTRPVWFVPDIAAIAALLNGQRPTEPIMWLDRHDGSIALALAHAGGVVFRGTQEEATSADQWRKHVGRIVAETGLSVGHTGAFIESLSLASQQKASSLSIHEAGLFMPQELVSVATGRLNGARSEARWWSDWGVAAGAVLARSGPLASLTELQHSPPVQKPSRIAHALDSLSRPRVAARVIAVSVLVLMFGQVIVAAGRLGILKLRFGDIQAQLDAAMAAKGQLAVYKELQRQDTWPMTKLLADITTNTPLGIELDSIKIEGGKDFSVSGTAIANGDLKPTQVVARMQEHLRADSMFTDINVTWGEGNNLGIYQFDLSGKVANPYRDLDKLPIERDFGKWTYADRRDGKKPDGELTAADSASPPTVEPPDEPDPNASETVENDTEVTQVDPGGEASDGEESPAGSERTRTRTRDRETDVPIGEPPAAPGTEPGINPRDDIPPPITEDEIKAMSLAEAQAQLNKISKARNYTRKGDPETDKRLEKEFYQVLEQIKKLKGTS